MSTPPSNQFVIRIKSRLQEVRRAFQEFLALPTLMIVIFILLAIGAYLFERSSIKFNSRVYDFFAARVFVDAEATSNLLGNIAGSIITVTSITITLLLLIVQQSASNLTTQVFDQFLRRRSNQFYFGFFIGVAVYTLITLATVDEPFNPVFAASLVFLLTMTALFLLLVLFYVTIHQMRPVVILGAIHDHTLSARQHQQTLLSRTRRKPLSKSLLSSTVSSDQYGFVTGIDLEALEAVVTNHPEIEEIILSISIGGFVAYRDRIADVLTSSELPPEMKLDGIRDAIQLERSRDLKADPAYGITQLEQISWAVLSPSKSNLAPGLQAIYLLRDLLSHWAEEENEPQDRDRLPVVYNDDVVQKLILAFPSLAVIASVSKEHQVITAIFETFLQLYDRVPNAWLPDVDEAIERLIPVLDAFPATTVSMDRVLRETSDMLTRKQRHDMAAAISRKLAHTDKDSTG